jgi:hypothetical protein
LRLEVEAEEMPPRSRTSFPVLLASPWSVAVFAVLFFASAAALRSVQVAILPAWAPSDPDQSLGLLLQVQTTFASIAFAGLALLFQLASSPSVAAQSSREVLFSKTQFLPALQYVGAATVIMAIVAIWMPSDANVLLCFVASFLLTLALIAWSYRRAIRFFLNSAWATEAAISRLLSKLTNQLRELEVASRANDRLADALGGQSAVRLDDGSRIAGTRAPLLARETTTRLADINVQRLRSVAAQHVGSVSSGRIRAEAGQLPAEPLGDSDGPEIRPELVLNFRIDDLIPSGKPILTLVSATTVSEGLLERLRNDLLRCLSLKEPYPDAADELATLKDGVLVSISEGRTGSLKQGLDIYTRLFERILEGTSYRPRAANTLRYGAYGRHWDWLQRDIVEISEKTLAVLKDSGVTTLADHTYRLCRMSLEAKEFDALSQFLALYAFQWWKGTAFKLDSQVMGYILVSLQNISDFYFRAVTRDNDLERYATQSLASATFASILKECVDREDPIRLQAVLPYFAHNIRSGYGLDHYERVVKAAALLAISAWALFRRARADGSDALEQIADIAARLVPSDVVFDAYERAADDSRSREMPWAHWELEVKEPFSAHMMEFETFVAAAAVLASVKNGIFLDIEAPSEKDSQTASRIIEAIAVLRSVPGYEAIDEAAVERLKGDLGRLVEMYESARRSALAATPISPEIVSRFSDEVGSHLAHSAERLSNRFAGEAEVGAEDESRRITINSLVPREFFVQSDVDADPYMLGRDAAHAVIVAENNFIVSCLVRDNAWRRVSETEIQGILDEVDSDGRQNRFLIAVNSWRLAQLAGIPEWLPPESRRPGLEISVQGAESGLIVVDVSLLPPLVRLPYAFGADDGWASLSEGVNVAVRDFAGATERPVAQVLVGEELHWARLPGAAASYTLLV